MEEEQTFGVRERGGESLGKERTRKQDEREGGRGGGGGINKDGIGTFKTSGGRGVKRRDVKREEEEEER